MTTGRLWRCWTEARLLDSSTSDHRQDLLWPAMDFLAAPSRQLQASDHISSKLKDKQSLSTTNPHESIHRTHPHPPCYGILFSLGMSCRALTGRPARSPFAALVASPRHAVRAPCRTLIAPPTPGSGPLMERRADRALPSLRPSRRLLRTLPLFLTVLGASTLAIFNYQKSSSSVISSTLYALRTSPRARAVLGDEIQFRAQIPWIHGELNQLHGRIDISFWVKGRKGEGLMRFKSMRQGRLGKVSRHIAGMMESIHGAFADHVASLCFHSLRLWSGAWRPRMARGSSSWSRRVRIHSLLLRRVIEDRAE